MAWFFLFQYFQKRIGKTQHHTGIEAFGIDSGIFAKSKMSPVNQSHRIEEKKFMGLLLRHEVCFFG
jgi:hypothetical protein